MDHYAALGVRRNATESEIKSAYRKQAVLWHPDKHASSDPKQQRQAAERFKEASEAYQVLVDPNRRRDYDRGGRSSVRWNETYEHRWDARDKGYQHVHTRRTSWRIRIRNIDKLDALFHMALVGGALFGFSVLGGAGEGLWEWWNDGKLYHHLDVIKQASESTENMDVTGKHPASPHKRPNDQERESVPDQR